MELSVIRSVVHRFVRCVAGQNPFAWWIEAWIQLAESVCMILTLGFWLPLWSHRWACWRLGVRVSHDKGEA